MNTRRIERSPGGGGHTVTMHGVRQWVPGRREAAEAYALADLAGGAAEMARAVLERSWRASRGKSAAVEVSITVAAVR